jgi:hypothetical protein
MTRRRVVFAVVALITIARSAVFVFWEGSYFDSNQAVIGLMAKHLSELRAFPLFMYGQNYQLAVEAWLAAPVFLIAGVSVPALKIPLLFINLAVALLLVRALVRESDLAPLSAAVAALFFVLPGPGTTAKLLEASGGTLEPFLYVLLLWLTRDRPIWCGLILGVGVLHREFTVYGIAALMVLAAAQRTLFTRDALRRGSVMFAIAAVVWMAVYLARPHASAMGPGTTAADLRRGANQLEIARRVCLDLANVPRGFIDIARVHWPRLFSTRVEPVGGYAIDSRVTQGMPGLGLLLACAMCFALVRIVRRLAAERSWRKEYDFCAYLVLVAALSISGYVFSRCGVISVKKVRYDMLSLVGAVGLSGWYLRAESLRAARIVWIAAVLCWAAVNARAHGRLLWEYIQDPPVGGKRLLVRQLEARGVKYGVTDYSLAYPVAFLTNERIILSSSNRVRIREYQTLVRAHWKDAVRVQRRACPGGTNVMPGVYFCRP